MNSSSLTDYVSEDWQEWIIENLNCGCTPQSLIDIMIERDFEPTVAHAAVFLLGNQDLQLFENKGYVYEPPRFPLRSNTIYTSDREVRVLFRLEKPVVAMLDGILSPDECDELVRLSVGKLEPSTVVNLETGISERAMERTSRGTFFDLNETEFIAKLDRRFSEVMNWPMENGEGIQVLHYEVGAEYQPHYDYFPPMQKGSPSYLSQGGQRVSTLVVYLNDVEEGGGTYFPELNLTVLPKKGSALYFEYTNSLGQVDRLSLHGGSPVIQGEKWIATKWMRQKEMK